MKIIKNIFCQIFVSESNINSYNLEFNNYCIDLKTFKDFNINEEFKIPTLIIGWDFVKNNFDDAKISKKKLKKNLFWTFEINEDSESNKKDLDIFLKKSTNDFLPQNYNPIDFISNNNFYYDLNLIFSKEINYCYISNNALYVYNNENFTGINLISISYLGNNINDFFTKISKDYKIIFFNYDSVPSVLKSEKIEIVTLENICWICQNHLLNENNLYKFSPLQINEKYYPFLMCKLHEELKCEISDNLEILNRFNKKDLITEWLSQRRIHFSNNKKLILKYSNKRTITGRINCVDKRFNPQLLPKNDEIRKEIVSEFNGGKIGIFDFVSFETKLSVILSKENDFIENLKEKDLHIETSKIIFKKEIISETERSIGKLINHSIIYGIGNEKLKKILLDNNLSIKSVNDVREFLKPILENSKSINNQFKKSGFIINPYNTIIYPNKEWAVYNNYVQSIAADIVIDKLFKIKNLLKSKKTEFMYQIFDSFVFDLHPDELYLIDDIRHLLEKNGKYNFEVQYNIGNNLKDCTNLNVETESELIN